MSSNKAKGLQMAGWLFLLSTLLSFVAPSGKQKTLSPEIKPLIRPCRQTLKNAAWPAQSGLCVDTQRPLLERIKHAATGIYYKLAYPFKNNRVRGTIAFLFKSYPYHIQSLKQKCVSENT